MTKQEINKLVENLTKDGLTRGEAFVRIRTIFKGRLQHVRKGSKMEERFTDDLLLLNEVWLSR